MKDSTKPKDATSYKETAFGIIPRNELVIKEADGVAKGLEYILTLPTDSVLTPELLLELHRVCFDWIFPNWAGKYRTVEVHTSTHEFPHHSEVRELLKNFFDDMNERLRHTFDPIEIIAWAEHRITWIHPFQDYNGRIARLFCNYLMLRFQLPLTEIDIDSEEERKQYIESLKLADSGDIMPLQELIRKSLALEE